MRLVEGAGSKLAGVEEGVLGSEGGEIVNQMGGYEFADGVEEGDRSVVVRQGGVALFVEEEGEGDLPCWRKGVGEVQVACFSEHPACPFWAQAQQVEVGPVWPRSLPWGSS